MCGRFKPKKTWAELYEIFSMFAVDAVDAPAFDFSREEIRPTNDYPILRQAKGGGYEVAVCRWSTARATASAATGLLAPRKPFSNSETTCGTRLIPPSSSTPTQA